MQLGGSHTGEAYLDVLAVLLLGHKNCDHATILGFLDEQKEALGFEAADVSELLANACGDLEID